MLMAPVLMGTWPSETVTLGGLALPNVALAVGVTCGRNNQGTFTESDGLIGLAQGPLSLPSQLRPSIAEIFSYCLVEQSSFGTPSSPITFGNAAENSNVQYTPLLE